VANAAEIVEAMRQLAPPGSQRLDDRTLSELATLTELLTATSTDAPEEYSRYLAIRDRGIDVPEGELSEWLSGKTVLVTGGTGCVGSHLVGQIARQEVARLVSVSRGLTSGWPRCSGADYVSADINSAEEIAALFADVRPDLVFHLAAQRHPGLAEVHVQRTVLTNVIGTRNVISAAEAAGVRHVVTATTGKALRPYSRELYTASKRAVEWLLASAAARGNAVYAAARFTHVVDNAIVYENLVNWCDDGVIRLHDPDTLFFAQSATESAQLLLCSGLATRPGTTPGGLWVHALRDLGWPVSLLGLAIGVLLERRASAPIYFSGHDPGYESKPFPGLYDPSTAVDVSPLLSAFEATWAEQRTSGLVDAFPLKFASSPGPGRLFARLEQACETEAEPAAIRAALDELCWSLLDATLAAVPPATLTRAVRLTEPYESSLSCDHRQMLAAIRRAAAGEERWK
jgi:NADPH:quinone reductase-like Zn-dependent oxidoreductase